MLRLENKQKLRHPELVSGSILLQEKTLKRK
jgi:hypothetical protein